MATILNTTNMPAPTSGKAAARLRLALGVTQNAVARHMGVFAATLARWEASDEPLSAEYRAKWHAALKACAQLRLRDCAKLGIHPADLPTAGLGRLLRLYTA
jgi:transcriptional regulator with XRE-family HTH domain